MATVVALESFAGRLSKDKLGDAPKDKQGNVIGPRPVLEKGKSVQVQRGQLYESSHPAVKAFPSMFGQPDAVPHMTIEQATAAPGEKRA